MTGNSSLLLRPFNKKEALSFRPKLLTWFSIHGRHLLPWKPQSQFSHKENLYRIWISEIMLQQTQVATVIPYFERFMKLFPTIEILANASQEMVLKSWEGLGYYSRARHLHHTAITIVNEHAGLIPNQFETLIQLKGIGKTTAAAILAQGYNLPFAILDGNVKRVLSRILGCGVPRNQLDRILQPYADLISCKENPADYTQAIMDFGASICARKPICDECFFTNSCVGFQLNKIDHLPCPNLKRNKPKVALHLPIFYDNTTHKLLISKRPQHGIWAGLYSLPEIDYDYDLTYWLEEHSISYSFIENLTPFTHQFSHYTLHGYPSIITFNCRKPVLELFPNSDFYTFEEISLLPKPTPIIDLLSAFSLFEPNRVL